MVCRAVAFASSRCVTHWALGLCVVSGSVLKVCQSFSSAMARSSCRWCGTTPAAKLGAFNRCGCSAARRRAYLAAAHVSHAASYCLRSCLVKYPPVRLTPPTVFVGSMSRATALHCWSVSAILFHSLSTAAGRSGTVDSVMWPASACSRSTALCLCRRSRLCRKRASRVVLRSCSAALETGRASTVRSACTGLSSCNLGRWMPSARGGSWCSRGAWSETGVS